MRPKRLALLAVADSSRLRRLYSLLVGPYRPDAVYRLTGEDVDAIYRENRWSSMHSFFDAGRYGVLVEWIRRLAPDGPVLDVGAGDGLLAKAMTGVPISYVGVDMAAATMERLQLELGGPIRRFVAGDARTYVPERRYPVIILSDVLYYLEDPVQQAHRFAGYLEPEGTLIVVMFLGRRQLSLVADLHRALQVVEQSYIVSHHGRTFVQLAIRRRHATESLD